MTRIIGKCAKLGGIVCVHVHSGGAGVRPEAAAESEERKWGREVELLADWGAASPVQSSPHMTAGGANTHM